jgi:hypothetical protein
VSCANGRSIAHFGRDQQREIKALSDAFASISESEGVPFLDVFDRLLASEAWMGEIAAGDGAKIQEPVGTTR